MATKISLEKIRLAHVITQLELGGAQQNTLYTVGHLNPEKYKIYLICGTGGILDKETQILPQVQTIFVPTLKREINPIFDLWTLIRLYQICRKEKIQLIHTHSSKAGILGRWAAKWAKVPVIIHTFHGFGFNDFQKPWIKWLFIWLEKITAKITDKLIVVSSENINKALTYKIGQASQYQVVHSGIKIQDFIDYKTDIEKTRAKFSLKNDDLIIGMIACFKVQKAPLDFIKIAAKVCTQIEKVIFLLVGDGELRPQIEALIKEYRLEDRIVLTGWQREVKDILQIMDVFVLTSLWEGLPRVFLEAMASSKPIIATGVDGASEVIKNGENGFLVSCHDVDIFSQKIVYLLQHPDLRQKFGEKGKNLLTRDFDIDKMVEELDKIYQDSLQTEDKNGNLPR